MTEAWYEGALVGFDLETTGVDPFSDHIIQIGIDFSIMDNGIQKMSMIEPSRKLCPGVSEEPRRTLSGRTYCPVCHRPVDTKWVVEEGPFSRERIMKMATQKEPPIPNGIEMVIRHFPDGTKPGSRLGSPNKIEIEERYCEIAAKRLQ